MQVKLQYHDRDDDGVVALVAFFQRVGGGEHELQPGIPSGWNMGFVGVMPDHLLYEYDYRVIQPYVAVPLGALFNARRILKVDTDPAMWFFGAEFLQPIERKRLPDYQYVLDTTERFRRQLKAITQDKLDKAVKIFENRSQEEVARLSRLSASFTQHSDGRIYLPGVRDSLEVQRERSGIKKKHLV